MRLRFAPSPTGHLHVGNARTALYNWLLARGQGGTFILRIEDTDRERSTTESERAILEDLRWLGLSWDEGPDIGGPLGPYRQSERASLYHEHAERLRAAGRAYDCFCTPEQLEADRQRALAAGQPPKYGGRCRNLTETDVSRRRAAGESAALRFRVPDTGAVAFDDAVRGHVQFEIDVIGDFILLRSDGSPAYNFAVVVDDGLMGVTDVIRGEDHISNTPRQILLYQAFGWTPPRFAHLALVLGPDHAPLSKRHGATSVAEFRAKGYLPEALANYLALVGWSPGGGDELLPLDELARRFALDGVSHSAGVFDEEKLAWANRHYLKAAPVSHLTAIAIPYLREAGFVAEPSDEGVAYLEGVLPIATASIDRLDQVPDRLRLIFQFDAAVAAAKPEVRAEFDSDGAKGVARAFAEELAAAPRLTDKDRFRAAAQRVREKTGQKGRALFHPIRVILTGAPEGPELDLLVPAIERGAELPASSGVARILGARERVSALVAALGL
jgi:glutamyl-tRNA synthetase/nondiscriminating glutamyl-tRNA synthetase